MKKLNLEISKNVRIVMKSQEGCEKTLRQQITDDLHLCVTRTLRYSVMESIYFNAICVINSAA